MSRTYSNEQTAEILRRAMAREREGGIGHEELLEAAREVGIDPAAVEAAALEVQDEHASQSRASLILREHRRKVWSTMGNLLLINAAVVFVDVMSGPGQFWDWVAVGSGLWLLRRIAKTIWPSDDDLDRAAKRLERRERRRLKRENRQAYQRERKERKKQTAEEFERVVEDGVQTLLRVAGEQLDRFNDRNRPQPGGQRVRVDASAESDESASAAGYAQRSSQTKQR